MPPIQADELRSKVQQFLSSTGCDEHISTSDAARYFYIVIDTMVEVIVEVCMAGGNKGPGPLPHQPKPPGSDPLGRISRREDYVNKMSGLLINLGYDPTL